MSAAQSPERKLNWFEDLFSSNNPSRRAKIIGATVFGSLLAGSVAYLAFSPNDSKIVRGVPAEVQYVDDDYRFGRYLYLEQCTADIEAARSGEVSESFEPGLGIAAGCYADRVEVNNSVGYFDATAGDVVTFPGDPSEHMEKIDLPF
jgi:hypothetical protein